MVYTVTVNPSLDYVMSVPFFREGTVCRSSGESIFPGGKGINVSIMLERLGIESRPTGFYAGFSGRELLRLLDGCGLDNGFIEIDGSSRINVKLRCGGTESDINAEGPAIPQNAAELIISQLSGIGEGDLLVLAGSLPKGAAGFYSEIMAAMPSEARVVVDASGDAMRSALTRRPFLVKPNRDELSSLAGRTLESDYDIVCAARELQSQGAENVLVSLDKDGALLLCADGGILRRQAPSGQLVNSVAAGDSMVAGFIAGLIRTDGSLEAALELAVAAGSATAFSEWIASAADVEALMEKTL